MTRNGHAPGDMHRLRLDALQNIRQNFAEVKSSNIRRNVVRYESVYDNHSAKRETYGNSAQHNQRAFVPRLAPIRTRRDASHIALVLIDICKELNSNLLLHDLYYKIIRLNKDHVIPTLRRHVRSRCCRST